MTWPIIEGSSLLHWHIHRGKRSITLDLRTEEAQEVFRDLVRDADAVIEAMRPGALARRGLGFEDLVKVNPRIVFCTISGYGMTGPYANLPSHGIAYDMWAGLVNPAFGRRGPALHPEHPSVGIHAGPLFGAFGILARCHPGPGHRRGLVPGDRPVRRLGCDGLAAVRDLEGLRASESEVTGNRSDDYERRAPGTAGMQNGVRYQIYASSDGYVLFMASEQEFWKNFCNGVGRPTCSSGGPATSTATTPGATRRCGPS